MRGEVLAAGLLLATLAFALAFLPQRTAWSSCGAAIAAMVLVSLFAGAPVPSVAFGGCWITLIATALSVYWPGPAQRSTALALAGAAIAGIWSGLLLTLDDRWTALPLALGLVFALFVAAHIVGRGWGIGLRVATSWLLAVALLSAAIPHLVAHPGYEPDHRE